MSRSVARLLFPTLAFIAVIALVVSYGLAQSTQGPYNVLKTARVGGQGGYDYIFADVDGRRLYIPRGGPSGRLTVFNLDTLDSAGTIDNWVIFGSIVRPTAASTLVTRPAKGARTI